MEESDVARQIRDAIASSIWTVPPIDEEPVIRLTHWQVIDASGELRLVGYHHAGREGRISTSIEAFDPPGLRAVTRSGRTYLLEGPSGSHPDANWVLDRWLQARGERRTDIRVLPLDELSRRVSQPPEGDGPP